MRDKQEEKYDNGTVSEDLLTTAERIRSLPRIRPTRSFKIRMTLYSLIPALGSYMVKKHEASEIERRILGTETRRRPQWAVSAVRVTAAVVVVLILAFGVFGVLTFAARNSKPGDALYSVKLFREDLELAFTWDNAKKAEKSLALAEARLSELEYLIAMNKLDADRVEAVASDYSDRTRVVEDLLRQDKALPGAQNVASQLKLIKLSEKNIERRLAAVGPQAAFAPAEGARVTVYDASGNPVFGDGKSMVKAKAGDRGQVDFVADVDGPQGARNLGALIELDGRSEILPLFGAGAPQSAGTLSAAVLPSPPALTLEQPELFTITLTSSTGGGISDRVLQLKDTTGTSTINGVNGNAEVVTDREGKCPFTVTKKSLDHVSRISATTVDASRQDLGEILVLGGLETVGPPGSAAGTVNVKSYGPASGPQSIELDNGLIRVAVDSDSPGAVIERITRVATGTSAGPLSDPLLGGETPADGVKTSGPRLAFAGQQSAGYEVTFEFPCGRSAVRKTYMVTLAKGNEYATVKCRVAVSGAPGEGVDTSPILNICGLAVPTGTEAEISGRKVTAATSTSPTTLNFDVGSTCAVMALNGSQVLLACPIDSDFCPDSWTVAKNSVGLRLPAASGGAGADSTVTAMIGVTDQAGLPVLEARTVHGVGESSQEQGAAQSTEGFLITTNPAAGELVKGRQRIRVGVYKQYDSLFEK